MSWKEKKMVNFQEKSRDEKSVKISLDLKLACEKKEKREKKEEE